MKFYNVLQSFTKFYKALQGFTFSIAGWKGVPPLFTRFPFQSPVIVRWVAETLGRVGGEGGYESGDFIKGFNNL